MAVERDDEEERLTRIEQMLEHLRKQQAELHQLIDESRHARETRAAPGPDKPVKPRK